MDHVNAAFGIVQSYALKAWAALLATTADEALCWAKTGFAILGLLSVSTLLLCYVWAALTHWDQNLKKKYNASWAIVTGASSGIGLSLVRQLAGQGLNVVLVALPDHMVPPALRLTDVVAKLTAEFPGVSFVSLPVVLGAPGYVETIAAATAALPISLVFNNAGYMVTGFFEDSDWARHEANIACNSTAAIALSHLFLKRMRASNMKGCITFTSSPANIMPSPFSCLYGATKAMVTHFATSLATEVKADGIDVSVIHPSPVATNFYSGAHAMPTLNFFKSTAGGPDHVAAVLLRGIGRSVIIDQGYYPLSLKLPFRIIDIGFLTEIMPHVSTTIADYKILKEAQATKKAAEASKATGKAEAPAAATPGTPAAPAARTPATGKGKARRGSVSAAAASAAKATPASAGSKSAGRRRKSLTA